MLVIRTGGGPVPLGRNHDCFTGLLQRFDHSGIGVITFVSDDGIGAHGRQKLIGPVQVAGLPLAQPQPRRVAKCINRGMDFGAQTAFAAANGLILLFFLEAPALC